MPDIEGHANLDATVQMFGDSADELAGLTLYDLSIHERENVDANIALIVEHGRFAVGRRKYRRKDGSLIDVELNASVVGHIGQRTSSIVARDVTEQRRYEERLSAFSRALQQGNTELHTLAVTDGLTRVGNRAAFTQRLLDEVARAAGGTHSLALLLLDVDRFKDFNDSFGHPAGDEVLKTIARLLQKSARNSDLVARDGGEEFALLCPDTEPAGAMILAERCPAGRRARRVAAAGGDNQHRGRNDAASAGCDGAGGGDRCRALPVEARGPEPDHEGGVGSAQG